MSQIGGGGGLEYSGNDFSSTMLMATVVVVIFSKEGGKIPPTLIFFSLSTRSIFPLSPTGKNPKIARKKKREDPFSFPQPSAA